MMKDGKREREREMGREAMLVRKYEYMNNMNKHETLTSVIGRVRNVTSAPALARSARLPVLKNMQTRAI